ncbi:hypothetical protein NMY22_g964 [Coprinellus aureogranulatus]|nr:hypothetical protein NMY22_g964 [Coprinellus aureogranulatus]
MSSPPLAPLVTLVSTRARTIQRLLTASLILTSITFSLSMVLGGAASLWIAPWQAEQKEKQGSESKAGSATQADTESTTPSALAYPPAQSSELEPIQRKQQQHKLPWTLRKPSIIAAMHLAFLWTASCIMDIYNLAHFTEFNTRYDYDTRRERSKIIVVPILEAVATVVHVGVLGTYVGLAWKERRKMVRGRGEVKWYQLGNYTM